MNPFPPYWRAWEQAEGALGALFSALFQAPDRERPMARWAIREAVASAGRDGLKSTETALFLMLEDPRGGGQTPAARAAYDVRRALDTVFRTAASDRLPDHAELSGLARRATLASHGRDGPGSDPVASGLDIWRDAWTADAHLPGLVRSALSVRRFHMADPFGGETPRIGRLLIPWIVFAAGKSPVPVMMLSAQLGPGYVDVLYDDEDVWIGHFLKAATAWAEKGAADLPRMQSDREAMLNRCGPLRSTSRLPAAIDFIMTTPVFTSRALSRGLGVTQAAADRMIDKLEGGGVVSEITGRKHFRVYAADRLVEG